MHTVTPACCIGENTNAVMVDDVCWIFLFRSLGPVKRPLCCRFRQLHCWTQEKIVPARVVSPGNAQRYIGHRWRVQFWFTSENMKIIIKKTIKYENMICFLLNLSEILFLVSVLTVLPVKHRQHAWRLTVGSPVLLTRALKHTWWSTCIERPAGVLQSV